MPNQTPPANVIAPNAGAPPVVGHLTPPDVGAPPTPNPIPPNAVPGQVNNPNVFQPYGTGGFYQRGTNFFYPKGTNGFYRRSKRGEPDGYYPDEAGVYRRGPRGFYRRDNASQGNVMPGTASNSAPAMGTNGSPYRMR